MHRKLDFSLEKPEKSAYFLAGYYLPAREKSSLKRKKREQKFDFSPTIFNESVQKLWPKLADLIISRGNEKKKGGHDGNRKPFLAFLRHFGGQSR